MNFRSLLLKWLNRAEINSGHNFFNEKNKIELVVNKQVGQ